MCVCGERGTLVASQGCVRPLLIAATLAACDLPTTATLDPSAVVTGIYTLTATSQSDTCNPQRFVGAATVPIFADTSTIEIVDEDSSLTAPTIGQYDLAESADYTAHVPAAGATYTPCPSGGSFALDFTLMEASATAFEVTDDETWTIVSACAGTVIDATTVPNASCTASRTLDYALVSACATPCTIVENDDVPTCTCPATTGSD
jgi:hypothetical protein